MRLQLFDILSDEVEYRISKDRVTGLDVATSVSHKLDVDEQILSSGVIIGEARVAVIVYGVSPLFEITHLATSF